MSHLTGVCLMLSVCMVCPQAASSAYLQVNFAYKEAGEQKQALVKVRLCPKHALQLNHKQNHKLIKKRKREQELGQKHASRQPARSDRGEASIDLGDSSGSDVKGDADIHLSDAARANNSSDHKGKRSKHHGMFDGLFD